MSNRKLKNPILSLKSSGWEATAGVVNEVSRTTSGGLRASFPSLLQRGFAAAPCDYKMPALDPATTYREHHPEAERGTFYLSKYHLFQSKDSIFRKPSLYCPHHVSLTEIASHAHC